MSLGATLGANAAFAPTAQACWTSTCRTYVSQSTNQNSREYGPWNGPGEYQYVSSNRAHYNDCVQMYVSSPGVGKEYLANHCGYSPYYPSLPTDWQNSQGLAWRTGGGCGFIWGRELGSGLRNSKHVYGAC